VIAAAGAHAIATSSAGVAFALGFPDGQRISRTEMLGMVRRIAGAVDLPVSADVEAGMAPRRTRPGRRRAASWRQGRWA